MLTIKNHDPSAGDPRIYCYGPRSHVAAGKFPFRVRLACALLVCVTTALNSAAVARCTTSPATVSAARYHVMGGTVRDLSTGLIWQRCSIGQRWTDENGCVGVIVQMNWAQARSLGSGDWQLPTREELSSLIVPGCTDPALDEQLFPDMELPKLWYWTSSADGIAAWYIAFGGGSARMTSQVVENSVRLVKRGV